LAPTVGIAATGFCYPGGILQAFIDKISKFFIDKIRKLFIDKISKFRGYRQQRPDRIKSSCLRRRNSSSNNKIID
jgi:hypothetical protein